MSEQVPVSGGGCGDGGDARAVDSAAAPGEESSTQRVRERLLARAAELGINGEELAGLAEVFDVQDGAGGRAELARLVEARLAAAQEGILELVERCAVVQADRGGETGSSDEAARVQGQIVELMATVGPLQAASAALAGPVASAACGEGCGCSGAAAAVAAPRIPASRAALAAEAVGGSDIVCTLDGGADAMRGRIVEWQDVLSAVTGREPAEGGVTLVFEHDEARTVELARLAAAEFACCSFFTFTLAVGPAGVRFTVTAPEEARDVITAVFGTAAATPTAPGGS